MMRKEVFKVIAMTSALLLMAVAFSGLVQFESVRVDREDAKERETTAIQLMEFPLTSAMVDQAALEGFLESELGAEYPGLEDWNLTWLVDAVKDILGMFKEGGIDEGLLYSKVSEAMTALAEEVEGSEVYTNASAYVEDELSDSVLSEVYAELDEKGALNYTTDAIGEAVEIVAALVEEHLSSDELAEFLLLILGFTYDALVFVLTQLWDIYMSNELLQALVFLAVAAAVIAIYLAHCAAEDPVQFAEDASEALSDWIEGIAPNHAI